MINKIQIVLLCLVLPLGILFWYTTSSDISLREIFFPGTPVVRIGGIPIRVEIANSDEERRKGLSGREGLAGTEGLLFIFPESDFHSIWMKDMNFPIDVIWIDENLTVIEVQKNLSPDSYPRTFRPKRKALYALETNVHFADSLSIGEGDEIKLPQGYLEN